MAQTTGFLLEGKPIIEIAIADAIPIPRSVVPQSTPLAFPIRPYRALLDTGADVTCLCDRVVKEARLSPSGIIHMIGGNGPSNHMTYIIQIGILCQEIIDFEGNGETNRTLFQLPDMYEAPCIRDNRWFDVIIGTDILKNYEFTLKKGGGFSLILT